MRRLLQLTPNIDRARTDLPPRYVVVGFCFLAAFICYVDRVNISVVAITMQERFGWSSATKGVVLSSFFLGYLLLQVPGGWLVNRMGGRTVLASAVLWWSLFTLLTPIAAMSSLPLLIGARVAMGLGEATMFPSAYNLFARWIPVGERSRAVSILLSGVPLGTVFALATTGWLSERYGWASVFYVFGGVGVAWSVLWLCLGPKGVPPRERHLVGPPPSPVSVPWRRFLTSPAVWALTINQFCTNWSLYLFMAWLPSYFRDVRHLSVAGAGLFSVGPWLAMFLMMNVAAWGADALVRHGVDLTTVRKIMQASGLLGCAGFLGVAAGADGVASSLLSLCGAMGALALTFSGFGPNHIDIAPRHADVLMGLCNTVGSLPGVVGVALTGWIVQASGSYASVFLLAAAVNVFGAVTWLAFSTARQLSETEIINAV